MTNPKISTKKLKAIVFTDIVDFTKISAEDEQQALDIINKQRELLKPIVLEHKGEWLKEIGDGLLFCFDSSIDAVRCSIKIQESLANVDDFKLRIGIHQGDIFITKGDVYGDDVNIASRVEAFAPIGGISISDKVDKDISSVKGIKTTFIGHKHLKGVAQEIKIKCISSHSLPKHQINIFSKLAYFTIITIGILYSFVFLIELLDTYSANDINSLFNSVPFITKLDVLFITLSKSLICFLLSYLVISYHRGISILPQKYAVFFSYFYISLFFLIEFTLAFKEDWTFETILLISIIFILAIFFTYIINRFLKSNKFT